MLACSEPSAMTLKSLLGVLSMLTAARLRFKLMFSTCHTRHTVFAADTVKPYGDTDDENEIDDQRSLGMGWQAVAPDDEWLQKHANAF